MSPARGALRLVRAAVLGSCCLLLALTGHVLGGGAAPSPFALLVLAVPVSCLAVLMTGDRAGLYRIGLTLALTQVGLHQAFMVLAQPHCPMGAPAMAAHVHSAPPSPVSCSPAMPMAGATPAMITAHAAAAVATGLLLWHGERLLWSLVAWLAVPLPAGIRPQLPRVSRRSEPHAVDSPVRLLVLVGGLGRRGPPAVGAT